MVPSNQPTVPTNRAFMVQLHADARPEQGHITGRVEHLTSGQAMYFVSLAELAAFIERTLATQQQAQVAMAQEEEDRLPREG